MTTDRFVAIRSPDWRALDTLLGNPRLTSSERRRLAALYRAALTDLGQLRTFIARDRIPTALTPPVLQWLNGVVARAHALLAMQRRGRTIDVPSFFARHLPQAVRRAFPRIALAIVLLAGSSLLVYLLCRDDVALARLLAGPAMARNAEGFAEMGKGREGATDAMMAAFYVTNNVQVAFIAFALGVTLGLGTLYTLVQNGVIMGVTLALVRHHGSLGNFLAFVASHSFIELGAIVIAAGAGLGLGRAIVAPGPYRRVVALKRAAREAATLVMGAACMLLLAAFFEAFVSPSSWAPRTKAVIGAVNATWVLAYYVLVGRAARDESAAGRARPESP